MSENWQRVHPASPFVHGWLAVVGLVYFYWTNTDELSWSERFEGTRLGWTVGLGAAALVLILIFYALSWFFTRYRLTASHVYVNSGMLFRSQKQARIERVQAIDIAQPLVARLLGLAELRFDVADGSTSVMRLAFLRKADAHRLRTLILDRAQAARTGTPITSAEAGTPEDAQIPPSGLPAARQEPTSASEPLVIVSKVPAGRLLGSLLLRIPTIIGLLFALFLAVMFLLGNAGALAGVIPALLGFGGWLYKELNNSWNFTASNTDTGLRISRGLVDTRQQSIPAGRVQAIKVSAPMLWRLLGWYRIEVNALGLGEGVESETLVMPVGDFESVCQVLGILLPDLGIEEQREVLHTAVTTGADHGFTVSPPRARLISPGAWKHQAFLETRTVVITRYGWLARVAAFIPHQRIQGVSWHQGPLDRRRQLAEVRMHSAGGSIMGYAHQIDQGRALELFEAQAHRAAER